MFEMGLVVGLGLLVVLFKAPPKVKVAITSKPVAADITIFIGLCILHGGTFSGIMVATIGAFVCSVVLSMAKRVYGFYAKAASGKRVYVRGMVDLSGQLGKRTLVAAYA